MQMLVFWVKKTSLAKQVTIFKNCRFLFRNFLMKVISCWYVRNLFQQIVSIDLSRISYFLKFFYFAYILENL